MRKLKTTETTMPAFSLECAHSRGGLTEHEGMDVVRPFVGINAFEVRHVTHRGVLGENADGAEETARLSCDVGRHIDIVALGERHLLWRVGALVLQAAEVERDELRLGDLVEQNSTTLLLQLEAAD